MVDIRVEISEKKKGYPIIIDKGSRDRVGQLLTDYYHGDKILMVTDENLYPLYGAEIIKELKAAGFSPEVYIIPAGEQAKNFANLQKGYDLLIEKGFNRDSLIITLGGGVVGDLGGFLAATYLRGIPFVQIPTTLLAQVDSSVGGKTAVNHQQGKNLIGAFYQPRLVVIDPDFLTTLPGREIKTGMAEVIKTGMIADRDFCLYLLEKSQAVNSLQSEELIRIISTACKIKARIVEEDEKESGKRAFLNYGHTIAHALEAVTEYERYTHGEAVALGMVAAGEIAREMGLIDRETQGILPELLKLYGLPVRGNNEEPAHVYSSLFRDKKIKGNRLHWVLLERIGIPIIRNDVDKDLVLTILEGLTRDENCGDSRS